MQRRKTTWVQRGRMHAAQVKHVICSAAYDMLHHRLASSFMTAYADACASCKWLPLRQVNTDNI